MKLAEKVGDRLRGLREKMGISQRELARRLKMPNQTLSNYERGNREADYETLKLLSDYFNVTIDYLIKGTNYSSDLVEKNSLKRKAVCNFEEFINMFTVLLDNKEVTSQEHEEIIIYLRSRRIMEELKNK